MCVDTSTYVRACVRACMHACVFMEDWPYDGILPIHIVSTMSLCANHVGWPT